MKKPSSSQTDKQFDREMEVNRQAYKVMKKQIQRDYTGKYVALAFGRIAAVADSVLEINKQVDKLKPAPRHVEVFPADEEPLFDGVLSPYSEYV